MTTEGDCEGRSTDNLGFFKGHVADIAAHLRKKTFYSLNFHPVKSSEGEVQPVIEDCEAVITLDIQSGTWPGDMSGEQATAAVNYWLRSEPTKFVDLDKIKKSNYYAAIKLSLMPKDKYCRK